MSLIDKKYFSITEVADLTGIPAYKLRYLEKSSSKMEVFQIRGRRYYTIDDIKAIREKFGLTTESNISPSDTSISPFSTPKSLLGTHIPPANNSDNSDILNRIDSLIAKLVELERRLESH